MAGPKKSVNEKDMQSINMSASKGDDKEQAKRALDAKK